MNRILQAVSEVIAERGAERIGINAVAEKAGVNKVLIYRYFGNWEGLMEQFIKEGHFLTAYNEAFLVSKANAADIAAPVPVASQQIWTDYMLGLLRELRARKTSQELLKWEISNPYSTLTQRLTALRNDSYKQLTDQLKPGANADINAVNALITSGIAFLVLLSNSRDSVIDVDLQSEAGWQRIEEAIRQIYNGLNATPDENSEQVAP